VALRLQRLPLGRRHVALSRAHGRDLGPDERPVHHVVAQQPHARIVARELEIPVQKPEREIGASMLQQVHSQKRGFADHVDPAQVGAELDAIEDAHTPVDQRDVAEVQIAVAFAHAAFAHALVEQRRQRRMLIPGPCVQLIEQGAVAAGE
jgi:hypothetical protein